MRKHEHEDNGKNATRKEQTALNIGMYVGAGAPDSYGQVLPRLSTLGHFGSVEPRCESTCFLQIAVSLEGATSCRSQTLHCGAAKRFKGADALFGPGFGLTGASPGQLFYGHLFEEIGFMVTVARGREKGSKIRVAA